MAINYTALATEINTDPQALGYAPFVAAGNDVAIADALNLVRASIDIDRDTIEAYEVIDATVPAEWTALNAAEKQRYQTITGAGKINVKNANVRSSFLAMFAAGTTTRANLAALQSRDGSRAEQLFGAGTSISITDVARALGRG